MGLNHPDRFLLNGLVAPSGDSQAPAPTTQASSVTFAAVAATTMTVNFVAGNGAGRIVLMKSGGAVDADPADFTTYTANAAFGSGTEIGTGNFVVAVGAVSTVDVTGLTAETTYHVAVYEYEGSGTIINYLQASPATGSQATTA